MDFIKKNSKIFLIVGILAAIIAIYFMFFSGEPVVPENNMLLGDPTLGGLVSDISMSQADAIIGQDLLVMLGKLNSISLDTSIFSDKAFLNLKDKSHVIESESLGKAVGRRNPFSDFAGGSGTVAPKPAGTAQ
jgi:hypothetical protein